MPPDRVRDVRVIAVRQTGTSARDDQVATEEPLEIRIDDRPLAVVMRTPGEDMELAAGFLKAETVIRDSDDVDTIRHCHSGADPDYENVVNVTLSAARRDSAEAMLQERMAQRSTVTSASCGVCGKRTIESLHTDAEPFAVPSRPNLELIATLPDQLRAAQQVFDRTGGLHAAAVFDGDGQLLVLREDVGRHNAVDKCVGFLLLREMLPVKDATLMVSGRTSFEIVQKALVARIRVVAAVSAPSSLAIELARASNMGLCGFVREGALNVYAGEGSAPG